MSGHGSDEPDGRRRRRQSRGAMDAPSLPLDGSAEEVLTNLHELVLILSEAGPRQESVANSDIPARLVRLVDSHSSMEVKLEACRALLQISVNRDGRNGIVGASGINILLPLIDPDALLGEAGLGLSAYAVAIVANLALEASAEILRLGGLPVIVAVADQPNLTNKQNACRALFSMAIEFSDALVEAGAIRPLKEALEVQSPRVQKNAAGALANMSRNSSILHLMLSAGVLPSLIRLMHSTDARVVRQVIRNLHSCAVHPQASKAIVESGVLPIIVRLVHSPNSDFQKHGSGALCCISHKYAKEVAAAGGIPPLIAAGRRHKQALRAVQALSAAADVKGDVVAHGGLDMLADACSHKELRLAQVAVSALANLAIGSTKRAVLAHPKAWAALCRAALSGEAVLQEQACRAFFGLACYSSCTELYIRDGVLDMLLGALVSPLAIAARQHAAGALANLCNFPSSRDALLRKNALYSIARSLWTGTDKLRLHAGRALRLLGVVDVVLPYHDSESEQLKADLLSKVGESEFSDCVFELGAHGERVYGHRAIIGFRCPSLRRLLRCPPYPEDDGDDVGMGKDDSSEDDDGDVAISLPDVETSAFWAFLSFLYTGCVTAAAKRQDMIALAERFNVVELAALYHHKISKQHEVGVGTPTKAAAASRRFSAELDRDVPMSPAGRESGGGHREAASQSRGSGSGSGGGTGSGGGRAATGDGAASGSGAVAEDAAESETKTARSMGPSIKKAALGDVLVGTHAKRPAGVAGAMEPGAVDEGEVGAPGRDSNSALGGGRSHRSNGNSDRVLELFAPLFRSSWMADVKIRANDGMVILAHKVVLCGRCEYLHAMFDAESNWRESRMDEVPVDVGGDVFSVLCEYMYTGAATMTVEQAPAVLLAAAQYLLPGLQLICEHRLATALESDWSALQPALLPRTEVSAPTLRAYCLHRMLEAIAGAGEGPVPREVVSAAANLDMYAELEHWADQWGFESSVAARIGRMRAEQGPDASVEGADGVENPGDSPVC